MSKTINIQSIESKIYFIRGQRVMLSVELASLYGVEVRALIQAVKRNKMRFPEDFLFQLSKPELENLKSQIVISSWGGARTRPYAFTEQGVAMLSSVLKSTKAIWMNIQIMRAFVQIKQIAFTHKELSGKLNDLEQKVGKHDEDIQSIIAAIQQMISQEDKPKRRMGFHVD